MNTPNQSFQFGAMLSGANEVPPVNTPAFGTAGLSFSPDLTSLRVVLSIGQITQLTVAHIHLGRPGQNGPIVAFLYGPAAPANIGPLTVVSDRTITAANLMGPLLGMPLSALAAQMMAGNTYVNAHTVQHPNGETRGQVVRLQ